MAQGGVEAGGLLPAVHEAEPHLPWKETKAGAAPEESNRNRRFKYWTSRGRASSSNLPFLPRCLILRFSYPQIKTAELACQVVTMPFSFHCAWYCWICPFGPCHCFIAGGSVPVLLWWLCASNEAPAPGTFLQKAGLSPGGSPASRTKGNGNVHSLPSTIS